DLRQAVQLYETIAQAARSSPELRTGAWYRLGRALRRLGRNAEAREALEKAAKGRSAIAKEARALLQDAGKEKEKRKELRARARAILEDADASNRGSKLIWIGPAAVPEIVRYLEAQWRTRRPPPAASSTVANCIWVLGGDQAEAYLSRVLAKEDPYHRRALAHGIDSNLHPELLETATRFLEDAELGREATRSVVYAVGRRCALKPLLKLAGSANPDIAFDTWVGLSTLWGGRSHVPDRETEMAALVPVLRASLDSEFPRVVETSRRFLRNWGLSTSAGRRLLLDLVPGWPRTHAPTTTLPTLQSLPARIASPANRPDVLRAAQRLGPFDSSDRRGLWLRELVRYLSPHWGRSALPDIVELIGLGYFHFMGKSKRGGSKTFYHWLSDHAGAADLRTVLPAMERTPHVLELASWLWDHGALPESAWPVLRRAFDRLDASARESEELEALFRCMGSTGAEGAIAFFLETGKRSPHLYGCATGGLAELAEKRQGAALQSALREFMLHEPGEGEQKRLTALDRDILFKVLMGMGDLETAKLYPRMQASGLGGPGLYALQWLPREKQLEAWAFLLDQGASYWKEAAEEYRGRGEALQSFSSGLLRRRSRYSAYGGNPTPLPVLVARLGELLVREKDSQGLPGEQLALLARVLDLPGKLGGIRPEDEKAIHELTTLCLQSQRARLRAWALVVLGDRGPRPEQRNLVVRGIFDESPEIAEHALRVIERHVTLTPSEMRSVIALADPGFRSKAVRALLPEWKGEPMPAIQSLLEDESAELREAACLYLGRWTDARVVPALLATLRDPASKVREAAEQALRSIRFYHEQKAHWDRVAEGSRIHAASAAEALVKQADPREDKAVRLLAIRSLGLLGKVETLPFLIDYSREKDPEIASAARKAVEAVHAKAATGR
ncbi:MAG: HEAT repeat domain-containing protein, partial [Planctomycetota bacterium]